MTVKSELFEPEEISIIQSRQLRKTIHYIYQRSPFYRDLFDHQKINPAEIKSLAELALLPTTSRQQLRQGGRSRFLCVRPEEIADIVQVPGKGREPLLMALTDSDLSRLAYNDQLSLTIAGLGERDMTAVCLNLDMCCLPGMSAYLGLRRLGGTTLRLGLIPPEKLLEWLDLAHPTVVMATPSYLKQVVSYAAGRGLDLGKKSVRKLICLGEAVRARTLQLNELGQSLAQAWNAGIYAAAFFPELSFMLCDCEAGRGAHVHPELGVVEVVNEAGAPLPDGEIGELCVTCFGVAGMPLLRYRTNMLTYLQNQQCACGRWTTRLGPNLGRKTMVLQLAGTTLYSAELIASVQAEPSVSLQALTLDSLPGGGEEAVLWVASADSGIADTLRQKLQEKSGACPAIRLAQEKEIMQLGLPEPCGYPDYCLDRRTFGPDS